MAIRNTITALLVAFSLTAPVVAQAADAPAKSTVTQDVETQLRALKKAVGAGEISSKEYQKRKEALVAGSAQTAKSTPK